MSLACMLAGHSKNPPLQCSQLHGKCTFAALLTSMPRDKRLWSLNPCCPKYLNNMHQQHFTLAYFAVSSLHSQLSNMFQTSMRAPCALHGPPGDGLSLVSKAQLCACMLQSTTLSSPLDLVTAKMDNDLYAALKWCPCLEFISV